MRLIYLVRAAQLLVTLRALWMLYTVSEFCENFTSGTVQCGLRLSGIPHATPEEIAEFIRVRKLLRPVTMSNDTDNATSLLFNLTTTDQEAQNAENENEINSTVTSSIGEIKKRVKREEAKLLPGNGLTEGERKAKTVEPAKVLGATIKEEENTEAVTDTTGSHLVKKIEELMMQDNWTIFDLPLHEFFDEKKSEEKKEDPANSSTPTEATMAPKNDKKAYLGAKVEIPSSSGANTSDSGKPIPDKRHTVKKDLKAHFLVPAKIEKKEVRVPVLAPVQEKLALEEKSDAFLQEVRCVAVTAGAFLGMRGSPYAEQLKGLFLVGPLLVMICIYLVVSVLRTKLGRDDPTEYIHFLGCIFHSAMWMIIGLTMYYIYHRWSENWTTVSAKTFSPDFPSAWSNLSFLSSFMMVAVSIETWFYKRLFDNLVLERSYRCYEVIDNSDVPQNQGHFSSRTNVY